MTEDNITITLHIAVGSGNPVKINSVKSAFQEAFASSSSEAPEIKVVVSSHNVPSDVPDQPVGDTETKLGAKNRAEAAYKKAMEEYSNPMQNNVDDLGPPDFSVGLEGGVEESDGVLWCMAWMAIIGTDSPKCQLCQAENNSSHIILSNLNNPPFKPKKFWSFGRTGSFPLPPKVTALVKSGMELGEADDLVFKRVNSKQGSGTVGILTKGMIDRTSYYDHALKLALVPWIRPELYLNADAEDS